MKTESSQASAPEPADTQIDDMLTNYDSWAPATPGEEVFLAGCAVLICTILGLVGWLVARAL